MKEIFNNLGIDDEFTVSGNESLPSQFAVTRLAVSSLGAVGIAVSTLLKKLSLSQLRPSVSVDRPLASLWFARSIYPIDWVLPPLWNTIAGDYQGRDGWIKLHTNLCHHREAALSVLGCTSNRKAVAAEIKKRDIVELETEIVAVGGVAAAMLSRDQWQSHPQGVAVACEPLIAWSDVRQGILRRWPGLQKRPLAGLRILDLTRVLAGPVATRTLAGFGATVLRIDPPDWSEPNIVPDITLGKRCCHLDLQNKHDRLRFEQLLHKADILIHGYRPYALENLGYDQITRQQIAPNLIEVSLDAYGWTGPWSDRRGFDSLVQMSCGIANAGMQWAKKSTPTPLPVQALDHTTGYLMAAACIRALTSAVCGDGIKNAKLSLARTAELLFSYPQVSQDTFELIPRQSHYSALVENTPWGKAQRLKAPLIVDGTPMIWERPSCELGSYPPSWD